MLAVLSYEEIINILTQRLQYGYYQVGKPSSVRMTGILFSLPTSALGREEIVPNLDYFSVRSGKHVDFFCAGYGASYPEDPDFRSQIAVNELGWRFSPVRFDSIRREVESRCDWKYSGGSDLILTNARLAAPQGPASLAFDTVVKCYLDHFKRIQAIPSVMEFFEQIFRFAETAQCDDPTWGFSDSAGFSRVKQSLLNVVLSLFPKNVGDELRRVAAFSASRGEQQG